MATLKVRTAGLILDIKTINHVVRSRPINISFRKLLLLITLAAIGLVVACGGELPTESPTSNPTSAPTRAATVSADPTKPDASPLREASGSAEAKEPGDSDQNVASGKSYGSGTRLPGDAPSPLLGTVFGFGRTAQDPPPPTDRILIPASEFSPSDVDAISEAQVISELAESSIDISDWATNFSLRTVPYNEIVPADREKTASLL